MALTAQQIADTRHYMGYSVAGDDASRPWRELAYSNVSYMGLSLDYRLAHLSAEEEARLTGFFLVNLAAREQEIQDAAGNLDTAAAAVWTHNLNEITDRRALFNALRLELCRFLGFPPGSGLQQAGNKLIRS
ncbi:conserved protein of unknown function (plasmid) [Rhodovastum atsumiense]|uniref:Uncharacterized protein n=1 Tax=Rhodovastum atsumiense TaxID=504468 RepID=A0A5M6IN29_9PROT|nr:hypothetical protein [Rhodovastum atsumiense]KAA5609662.1 hypothetical protein F1189_23150 [Rhodovastum atsumiense]CAH2606422.1 conserved protein of unknown function [Rhodovastum atsumiense]